MPFDYFKWQKFLIKDMTKAPTVPHYVVMSFETKEYTTPGYDRGDPADRHNYEEVRYYSFLARKDWEEMINQIYSVEPGKTTNTDRKRYSFFKSMGRVEPQIDVKVTVTV